jgi:hypothetical protein
MNITKASKYLLCALLQLLAVGGLNAQSAHLQLEDVSGGQLNDYRTSGEEYHTSAPAYTDEQSDASFTEFYMQQASSENRKGVDCYNAKNWACAVKHFRAAIKFNPNNSIYQNNLSNAEAELNYEKQLQNGIKERAKMDQTFIKTLNKDISTCDKQQKKMRKTLASYVPPLGTKRVVEEGIILGLTNTSIDNDVFRKNLKSPFTGKDIPYYPTTDDNSGKDIIRGILDHLSIGNYTLKSEVGQALVAGLNGTHFNTLLAHSNGATVAEALIREGIIEVDELNIIGGDRSLANFQGFQELIASGKVKKIVVWVNPGDIIPYGTSMNLLSGTDEKVTYYAQKYSGFVQAKLTSDNKDSKVVYRTLKGPEYSYGQERKAGEGFFDAHGVFPYFKNLETYQKVNGGR